MELYEEMQLVRGLYGSEFNKHRACAFCSHHRCYLTVKQVKQHECLRKQCWYLRRNEEHDWWRQREVMKQKKKEKKKRIN